MNINIHIERLILDGLRVASHESDSVQAAVERELSRLLTDKGFDRLSAQAVPHVFAPHIQLTQDGKPSSLGHQIAQAIHGTLTRATASRHEARLSGGPSG